MPMRRTIPAVPTRGLLISMCIRHDHGFLAADQLPEGGQREWLSPQQRAKGVAMMRRAHRAALAMCERGPNGEGILPRGRMPTAFLKAIASAMGPGAGIDDARRAVEEMSGCGFWTPTGEARYAEAASLVSPAAWDLKVG